MTKQEAVDTLKSGSSNDWKTLYQAIDIAISALEELIRQEKQHKPQEIDINQSKSPKTTISCD